MARTTAPDVIVLPAHNRRAVTIAALRRLVEDGVPTWAEILLVDDGSTDGTAESVRSNFGQVQVLRGTGSLWWGGAIRLGMEWALARGAQRIFWLNDDCEVPPGGLQKLRDFAARGNAVTWITALAPGGANYGAHRKTAWGVRRCTAAEEARGAIDTFSGNCVCLPRSWIERVGLPDARHFPHGLADLDYGLRLQAAGAPRQALPGVTAANADPSLSSTESWLASTRPMREIWREFSSPRSFLYFPAWREFAVRHWGPVRGPLVFALPYARWLGIALVRTLAPALGRAWVRRRVRNANAPGKNPGPPPPH
jgi:GT2 family glycosyltransferase